MKNKLIAWCAAAALTFSLAGTSMAAQEKINVSYAPLEFVFDGELYSPPAGQEGFLYDNRTYVPLRFISYSLNKSVHWDSETFTVTVGEPKQADLAEINKHKADTKVQNGVKRSQFDSSLAVSKTLAVTNYPVKYIFDGVQKEIGDGASGFIVDGRLYVPLRFFAEAVGQDIQWNQKAYSIASVTKKPAAPQPQLPELPKPEDNTKTDANKDNDGNKQTPGKVPTQGSEGGNSGGGGGGGTGGGGTPTQPETPSVQQETETAISNLEASCTSELNSLLSQYKSETDEEKKKDLISAGQQALSNCDSQFESILSNAKSKGLSDSLISSYKSQYEQKKLSAYLDLIRSFD